MSVWSSKSGPWANGEPNNAKGLENCAEIRITGPHGQGWNHHQLQGLNDITCSSELPIICEKNGVTLLNWNKLNVKIVQLVL